MWIFWLKFLLVLVFGIMRTNSGGDPFPNQPRIVVEHGHLTFRSAQNRNISFVTSGQGGVQINAVDMMNALSSTSRGSVQSSSMSALNRRMGQILNQWQSISELINQVNRLEENVTDIYQKFNQFLGSGQNRITNRSMRRTVAKVKILEDKVNHLTELLSTNECSSNPCRNGGTCVDSYNSYVCNCPSNWEGPTCESDVNECARYAGTGFGCQNGATCTNLPGSYRCDCGTNWYGIHCTQQHDDCSSASHSELCGHGTCVNEQRVQPGQLKYRCICDPGWTTRSGSPACTEDVDECQGPLSKCSVNPRVTCINLPGTFHCGPCPIGYTGNGIWCADINECEYQNGGCSINPYVECMNTQGSRRCGPCPAGYFGNGEQCMFQSVCNINRGGCHPLATCIENPAITGTYRECRCPPGYIGTGEGLTGCVQGEGMSCANNPCQHGTCQMIGQSYHCICDAGYFGVHCEQEVNPCFSNPCLNGGTCVRGSGTFTCMCSEAYSGRNCEIENQGCGGYLNSNNGTLHYPENSAQYDHDVSCAWVIVVQEDKVINITFDHFHLEHGYNCEYDFLQLNDGPNAGSRVLGRFCSYDLHGENFISTHNQIYLWFHSDKSVAASGFTIRWQAVDAVCGGILNETDYGSVRSPGYPGVYPANRTCSWLVQVPIGKRIQFSFATLMLEHHENCSFDYLKVFDGATERDPVIGTYCTTETPPPLITSGHAATLLFKSDESVQDHGFNIAYSSIPGFEGCGGTFTAPQGSITSPNYPNAYNDNLLCEWLIRIHPESRIKITFIDFNLEFHTNCGFDSLEIYDGTSDAAPLLNRFCGNDLPADILSNGNQLYIRFQTDASQRHPGFKFDYKTICGGLYTSLTGIVTSPYYPDPYPASSTCIYDIRLPEGYLVNLTIQNIDIEAHYDCGFDFLQVFDGHSEDSPSLALLCGYSAPESIISTFNHMWMKFETDGSVQNHGFYAQYEAIEIGCGGIMIADSGQIASPRHPDSYPNSISCTWLIRAPEGFLIRLSFTTFNLEPHENCAFDYLLIEDINGFQVGKYCSDVMPPVITSLDNTLLLKFVTDSSVAHTGFTADYEFLDAKEACGGNIYYESGILRSPGYPNHYPHMAHCVWVLQAGNNRQITLNFTSFNLEYHTDCNYDFLEIRNGPLGSSPLIGKYCGDQIMRIMRSHSNVMRLEFKTDGSQSHPGFELLFDTTSVGCGGELTSSRGSIVSPNYPQPYPLNADCEWLIRVSEGSAISLVIIEIDIEQHVTCQFDYLQIYDGDSENSKPLLRICNNQQNPGHLLSRGNTMLLRFRSDFSQEAGGFHVLYQTVCNNVLTKRRGVIESPNFPNPYPHNHNCTWTIKAPQGNNISISFTHLFMEDAENCSIDSVEVIEYRNGNEFLLGKFCGDMTSSHNTIHTTTNTAIVRLLTDNSVSREGFRLEYSVNGCGGEIIDKPYGIITSPNYPSNYPIETTCFWHILYPPGSRVELIIEDLDIEAHPECRFDFIRVYAGEDTDSPRLLNICHITASNATVVTSHGNQLYVHFHSDEVISHRGFKATFRQLDSGCGGIFKSEDGIIMSPNFQNHGAYSEFDECDYLIEVFSANLVLLEFYDFDMIEATNCSRGYVAIYDGNNSSAPLLMRHCGAKPEGFISATGNQMLVRLVPDGYNVAKGFRAHYKQGCGRRLLADDGGEITSPNYPNLSANTRNCSWIIYASTFGEKVSLTITHLNIPDNDNCSSQALLVMDGDMNDSPIIGQYCGRRLPPPIISRGSILHLFLNTYGIFRATYGLLSTHCGGSFASAAGSFSSPGYPTNYDMEMECIWTIEASAGSKVHITFQSFHLETSDFCNSDYLEIHENNPSGRLIGKYCGDTIPSNVTAAHKIWMKFRSDDIGTAPGFMAHYEIQHSNTLNGTHGEIASPGYPHMYYIDNLYEWTVIVPENMFVSVQFTNIGISTYGKPRCDSYVKIFDGLDANAPELGKFCGYELPEPVVSTGNVINILFRTMRYASGTFFLHWSAVSQSGARTADEDNPCFQEYSVNTTNTAAITSPNYPNNYPNGLNCIYVIRTPSTHHVDLTFNQFDLEGPLHCHFDKIEVYIAPNPNVDDWRLNGTYCGVRAPDFKLVSPNNVMKLIMKTDNYITRTGFNGTVTAKCGGHIFESNGVIRSSSINPPVLATGEPDSFECEWIITVRPRRTIQLTFDNFNIESDSACTGSVIFIRNGGAATSPPLAGIGGFCGYSPPTLPETSSNEVYVQVIYKKESGRAPVFDLRFNEMALGCGGRVYLNPVTPSVEISSPNYPNPPTPHSECEWIVISPSGSRIRVDFETEFHMNPNCDWGDDAEYLQLHDGGSENAELLKRYCGHDQPSSELTTGNSLFARYVTAVDAPEAGFKATLRIAQCGGTISSFSGTIQSPNYPRNYGSSIECEWFLKMKFGYHLTLTITDFETPSASNCSFTDYLEIRDMSVDGEILRTVCGGSNDLPLIIEVPGPQAYVKFKSNSAVTAKGFKMIMEANYEEGCGDTIEGPSGVITSPRYPNALSGARECFWKIQGPEGRRIKVTFDALNLPADETSDTCSSYVAVFNITHGATSRGRNYTHSYCGSTIPEDVESLWNILYVAFNTKGLSAGQGFSLKYSAEEESLCGGILNARSGIIFTPNFTQISDSYVDCSWRVDTAVNKTLLLKFNFLDIPGIAANFCRYGVLYLTSNGQFFGALCGNYSNGLEVIVPFPSTSLRLVASMEKPFRGFNGTYNTSDCGGVLDGTNTVITSPGYPNNYPPNSYCSWLLIVEEGEIIQLTTVDMQLEDDCSKDYVMVRNGMQLTSPIIGKFCGSHSPVPITSSGKALTIIFRSDEFGTHPGFKMTTAEVARGCGGIIHMFQGNFNSPNYPSRYGNNVECVWIIEYPKGYLVKVDFWGRFDIEMDNSCSKDYLKLDDIDDNQNWIVQEQYCGSSPPHSLISKKNKMRITFHSNDRVAADGFNLTYVATCGGNFTDSTGDIPSPNHPSLYSNDLTCVYMIGKSGDYITLTFEDEFSIEGVTDCIYDYIEIFEEYEAAEKSQGRFCGTIPPAPRTLRGPLIVKFITDFTFVANGFRMHYEILDCLAVLTEPTGEITIPKVGETYIHDMSCKWTIIAQPNRVLALRFRYFDLEKSYSCWNDYLEIFDGNTTSPSIGKFCGNKIPIVKSSGSQLTLRFRSDRSIAYKGFSAVYSNTYGPAQGCGGKLTAMSGEIQSLDIDKDGLYEPELDCGWTIFVNMSDQIIRINFVSFDLEAPRNDSCSDYLEIREDGASGPILGHHCGSTLPSTLATPVNQLFIHFHSDDVENKAGFKLTYTATPSPCGTSSLISTVETKILTSPNYPNAYPVNLKCKWTIIRNTTSYRNQIQILFASFDVPCNDDYVEVKTNTAWRSSTRQSVKLCGATPIHLLYVRSGATITFSTDARNTGSLGFSAAYRDASCSRSYSEPSGIITNTAYPSRYNEETECSIKITGAAGTTISLYFRRIETTCSSSDLKIYDGLNITDPLLATYCGYYSPNPIFSTGSSLSIEVKLPTRSGIYYMTYITTDKGRGCGGTIHATEGVITSPMYPQPYNKTDQCSWKISVPGYHTAKIEFKTFQLNSTSACEVNYVEIYEGTTDDISSRLARYCGVDIPAVHESRSSDVLIKLVTDASNNSPGFVLHFDSNNIVADNSPKIAEGQPVED